MALAIPGPAADLGHDVTPPIRSKGLPAGPGASLPTGAGLRNQVDLLAVAEGFAVAAPTIPELRGLTERRWVLLAVTDLFEAWAIGWPAGGRIELHDHGKSQGALVVATGTLTETTARATSRGVALIGTHRIGVGVHRRFGPRYVHDLTNDGEEEAISVHVYGPPLSTMTYYAVDRQGRLGVLRTEQVPPVGPFDTTSDHDPS
jgi:hypothetical protein